MSNTIQTRSLIGAFAVALVLSMAVMPNSAQAANTNFNSGAKTQTTTSEAAATTKKAEDKKKKKDKKKKSSYPSGKGS